MARPERKQVLANMGSFNPTTQHIGSLRTLDRSEDRPIRVRHSDLLPDSGRLIRTDNRRSRSSPTDQNAAGRYTVGRLGLIESGPLAPTADQFHQWLIDAIGSERFEHLVQINLDRDMNVLGMSQSSLGSVRQIAVTYRTVVNCALIDQASKVFLAHNHPSGVSAPSKADLLATRSLRALLSAIGIELVDHMIVTRADAFSMKSAGLI